MKSLPISHKQVSYLACMILIPLILFGIYKLIELNKEQLKKSQEGYEYTKKKEEKGIDKIIFSKQPTVLIKGEDSSIEFKLQTTNQDIKPEKVSSNKVIYKNVLDNTNLIYTINSNNDIKEDIELINKPKDEQLKYTFEIKLNNLTYTQTEDGYINPTFTDKKGNQYTIPPLIMTDSKNEVSTDLMMLIQKKDQEVPNTQSTAQPEQTTILTAELIPSKEWLLAEDRVYPVKIDPSLTWGQANWYDQSYAYRQTVSITNASGSNLTDFQVSFTIDTATLITAGKMQSDCDDIRITDINGKVIPHWIETGPNECNTSTTAIWTKIPTILTGTSTTSIFIYYGNSTAISAQNGNNVFEYFDDFSMDSLTSKTGKWNVSAGTWSISSGELQLTNCPGICRIYSYDGSASSSYIRETRYKLNGPEGKFVYKKAANGETNRLDLMNSSNARLTSDSGAYGYSTTISNDTWYRVKFAVSGTTVLKISLDGNLIHNRSDESSSNDGYFGFGGFNAKQNVDFVFQRKYASTEPTTSLSNEEKAQSPVAYWKFDEGVGTTAYDSTSRGNNGALGVGSTSPTWQSDDMCISGKCLKFDGVNNHVIAYNPLGSTSSGDKSISVWIKPLVANGGYIFSNYDSGSGGFSLILNSDKTIGISWTENVNAVKTSTTVELNKWVHLVAVYSSGSIGGKIYFNGNLVKEGNLGTEVTSGNWIRISGRWVNSNTGTAYSYTGFVDEPKLFNYALTPSQARSEYLSKFVSTIKGNSSQFGILSKDSLNNGLVGYWKMDEASWGNVTDSSGNSNDGTATGATVSSGKYSNGGSFDGGDYVRISSSSLYFGNNGPFTITSWIKPTSLGDDDAIIGRQADGRATPYIYTFRLNADGSVEVINFEGNKIICPADTLVANSWKYLTFSYNGKTVTGYINGTACGSASLNYNDASNRIFYIGSWYSSSTVYDYNGQIDEVRIYNRSLSEGEVTQLYNYAPGPVAYYTFDDGLGQTLKDSSGNGLNGTLGLTSSSDSYDPVFSQGKYGKALYFDGTNDYVSTSSPATTSSEFTLEFWTKNLGSTGANQALLYNGVTGENGYGIYLDNSDGLKIKVEVSSVSIFNTNTTLTNDTWAHIACTRDSTTLKCYKDGVIIFSQSSNSPITPSTKVFIGGVSSGREPYKGLIDDVKIYNYAISTKQIVQDMNASHPAVGSPVGSPLAYYKFNEGVGVTATNSGNGGSSLNGTLTNMSSPATSTSGWTNNGKFGKALNFDGSNDYVGLGDKFDDITTGADKQFTLSAWIKPAGVMTSNPILLKTSDTNCSENQRQYLLRLYTNSKLEFFWEQEVNGGYRGTLGSTPINDISKWYHVVVVYDGTKSVDTRVSLFVNGIQESTIIDLSGGTPSYIVDGTAHFGIGSKLNSNGAQCGNLSFNGSIDEVKIYGYALTSDEVKIEYNQGKSQVMGSTGTTASKQPDNSDARSYCPPGDTTANCAPIAEWKFDEGTDQSANDTAGGSNNIRLGSATGTDSNDPTWANGKIGKALSFDGTNDYAKIPAFTSPTSVNDFSVSAWVYLKAINPGAGLRSYIIDMRGDGTSTENSFGLFIDSNNEAHIYTAYSSGSYSEYKTVFTQSLIGRWVHLVGQRQSTTLKLYANGIQMPLTYAQGGAMKSDAQILTNSGRIGTGWSGTSGSYFFNGLIDQVRIYDYALSPAQIAWEYNRGKPVAWYKFDECQGTTIYDRVKDFNPDVTANNGTLTIGASGTNTSVGTCATSGAWNVGKDGKIGSSMSFDGTDDYVDVGNSSVLNFSTTNDFSITGWIKHGENGVTDVILDKRTTEYVGYALYISNSDNKLNFRYKSGGDFISKSAIVDNNWHHFAVVFDRDSSRSFYLDGRLDNTDTVNSTTSDISTSQQLRIGNNANPASTSDYFFNGLVDDLRIFNYALTDEQVRDVYNNGAVSFK